MDEATRARVIAEITDLIAQVGWDTTEMWTTGELVGTSSRSRVTEDFQGTQYAPWFEGGVFTGGRDEWVNGTEEAARLFKGQGITWETTDVVVLPRSEDEAVVSYRVIHRWPDARPPTQALFLETWKRRDGTWVLARHTAEKA